MLQYTFEELREVIPHRQAALSLPQAPLLPFNAGAVPIEICLAVSNRSLLKAGALHGERNRSGAKLVRDLIGVETFLSQQSIHFEKDAHTLFEQFCKRCNPPLASKEATAIWKSAKKDNPTPCLSHDKLLTCVKAYLRIQQGTKRHPILIPSGHESRATEANLSPSYEDAMKCVGEILQIDDEGRQDWEGGRLAQRIQGFSWNYLKSMYQKSQAHCIDFNPVDIQEFLESGPEERSWLIAGYISTATTLVLFADGGVGKTLLAYDLSKAIALGQPWNGFRVNQGKVLIIQTDEPEIDTRERLNVAGFKDIPVGRIHIQSHWQFSQLRKLEKWIEAERPAFVMIDSLTSANRNAVAGSEWDVSYAASLYNLRDIANTYGCSVMILHHENKAGGARGTTAIRNNVSEVWRLRKGTEKETLKPTQRILEIEKSRSGCNGTFQIELNLDNFSWAHQGDFGEDEGGPRPLSAQLISYLEARPGVKFEPEELLSEFPRSSKDAIRKQLERLRRRGLVESEERTKTHKTGACRYKVYFVEKQNSVEEDKQSLEYLSNVNETEIYQDVETLDSSKFFVEDVQRLESPHNNALGHVGQIDLEVQAIHSLQNQASQKTQFGSIQCGDRVYYRGSSSSLRNLCGEKMLDVLNVEEGVAECTFSTWVVTQKIPISDLQKVSPSEEQG